jgi:hypothetical protein
VPDEVIQVDRPMAGGRVRTNVVRIARHDGKIPLLVVTRLPMS